ncbi:MAG: hypothetical protein J1D77_03675 [Muribaculaceae bacterium]|nr:hypothetical protein [Muribaculaceae bacterium]
MKSIGATLEYTRHRNADIMRVFNNIIQSEKHIFLPRIFSLVADSPASRFWVSEERAVAVISAMVAGRILPRMRKNKVEMFQEILRRFLILKQDNPKAPMIRLISEVVAQPAPKFYLTPRTIGEIIFKIKKGFYK